MEINLLFLFTVVPAIILFGIAKSGLGGSVSLISIPLMTFMMPLNQALAILLPILIFSDFISAFRFRREFDLNTLKLMVPFAAVGAIIGGEEAAKKIGGSAAVLNAVEANLDGRNEQAKIIKNCLRGRGYKVLN